MTDVALALKLSWPRRERPEYTTLMATSRGHLRLSYVMLFPLEYKVLETCRHRDANGIEVSGSGYFEFFEFFEFFEYF